MYLSTMYYINLAFVHRYNLLKCVLREIYLIEIYYTNKSNYIQILWLFKYLSLTLTCIFIYL